MCKYLHASVTSSLTVSSCYLEPNPSPKYLRQVEVPIVVKSECDQSTDKICAGKEGKGVCDVSFYNTSKHIIVGAKVSQTRGQFQFLT